ncbi:Calcium-activated potassium channel subunit alpha-1 [Perkinsus olseni]|uniref:Calcium-activated potassium channel subunit alpha-1 n=1 Tax=Perkinsus olseni TaxID=32597 RepID=A0A7J6M1Q5_PEROL|nr:Calcium-activated potassium channel subunit alpha-1 [Perkinsus olseni]
MSTTTTTVTTTTTTVNPSHDPRVLVPPGQEGIFSWTTLLGVRCGPPNSGLKHATGHSYHAVDNGHMDHGTSTPLCEVLTWDTVLRHLLDSLGLYIVIALVLAGLNLLLKWWEARAARKRAGQKLKEPRIALDDGAPSSRAAWHRAQKVVIRQLFNFNGSVAVNWCILGLSTLQSLTFGLRWTTRRIDNTTIYLEFIANFLGLVDTAVKLLLTWRHWSQYVRVLVWRLPVETLLIRSLVLQGKSWWSFCFAASARMSHAWRNFTLVSDYWQRKGQNSFKHEVLNVMVIVFCWLWLASNTILTVEILGDAGFLKESFSLPQQTSSNTDRRVWSLFQAMYFTIITITTVGLGDFKPQSILGRLVVPSIILGGIAAFSLTTTKFLLLVRNQRIGLRHYRRYGSRLNVLVTGDPDLDSLLNFILEFFHPEKFGVKYDMIVLVPHRPISADGESFFYKLRERLTKTEIGRSAIGQLWFHHGTIMNSQDVRLIIGPDAGGGGGVATQHRPQCIWRPTLSAPTTPELSPSSVFRSFAHVYSPPSLQEDAENALRVLATKRAVENYTGVRIIACALGSADLFIAAGLRPWEVLCLHEWRATLLGASCRVPCFGTFVSNLVFAVEEDPALVSAFNWEDKLISIDDQEPDDGDPQKSWRAAYEHSLGHELYGIRLSSTYRGWAFTDILHQSASISDYRVTLIGIVEITMVDGQKELSVYINPGSLYRVPHDKGVEVVGVFIATTADAVAQPTGHPDLYGRTPTPDDDEYSDSSATDSYSECSIRLDGSLDDDRKVLEDRPPECDFIEPERLLEIWKEGVIEGRRQVAMRVLSSGALPIDDIHQLMMDPHVTKKLKAAVRERMKLEETNREAHLNRGAANKKSTRASVTETTLPPPLKALTHPSPGCKQQRFVLLCCCGELPAVETLRHFARTCRMQVLILSPLPPPTVQLLGRLGTAIVSWRDASSSGVGSERTDTPIRAEKKVDKKIWYLQGDPLKASHLRRAGYLRARAIMVIGGLQSAEGGSGTSADVRQVFAVRLIEQLLNVDLAERTAGDPLAFLSARRPPVIAELFHEKSHRLIPIRPDTATAPPPFIDEMTAPHNREVYRCGRWAAGKVMLPSRVWTGVLVEAFRSESFMSIVESLLKHTSKIEAVDVSWITKPYGQLRRHFLRTSGSLPVAIIRTVEYVLTPEARGDDDDDGPEGMAGVTMSHPMLLTNPPHELPLSKGDSVIVLQENRHHFPAARRDECETVQKRPMKRYQSMRSVRLSRWVPGASRRETEPRTEDKPADDSPVPAGRLGFRRSALAALVVAAAKKGGDTEQELETEEAEYQKAKEELVESDKQHRRAFGSFWSPTGLEAGSRRTSIISGSRSSSANPEVPHSVPSAAEGPRRESVESHQTQETVSSFGSVSSEATATAQRSSSSKQVRIVPHWEEEEEAAVAPNPRRRRRSSLAETIMQTTEILKDYGARRGSAEPAPQGLLNTLAKKSLISADGGVVLPDIASLTGHGSTLTGGGGESSFRGEAPPTGELPRFNDPLSPSKLKGPHWPEPPSTADSTGRRRISTTVGQVNPMEKYGSFPSFETAQPHHQVHPPVLSLA